MAELLIFSKMFALCVFVFLGTKLTFILGKLEKYDRVTAGWCLIGFVLCWQIWSFGL